MRRVEGEANLCERHCDVVKFSAWYIVFLKTKGGSDCYTEDETMAKSERYCLWFVMLLSP